MTLEQYAYLAEILGVIVIVVTLIFLTVQVRQGTALLRSESRQALLSNDQSALALALEHSDLYVKLLTDEKLSAHDQYRFSWISSVDMRNREHEYLQYRDGFLDEATWLTYRQIIPITHATRRGRKWWDSVGREAYEPEFAEMVDELLRDAPDNDLLERLGDWE